MGLKSMSSVNDNLRSLSDLWTALPIYADESELMLMRKTVDALAVLAIYESMPTVLETIQ